MKSLKTDSVLIQNSNDVVLARQKVRQWASELKFSLVDQTKLVTAASELARNALDHGKGGRMVIEVVESLSKVRSENGV
jgi:serine/threonine-protein kinase RsbT